MVKKMKHPKVHNSLKKISLRMETYAATIYLLQAVLTTNNLNAFVEHE